MDLETILSSACRRRIIKILASEGSTNIMELIRKANSKYPQLNSEVRILQTEDIVIDEHVGRMRIIKLNKENPKTLTLLEALKILNNEKNINSKSTKSF
jgi:predicted transcriptional regulator